MHDQAALTAIIALRELLEAQEAYIRSLADRRRKPASHSAAMGRLQRAEDVARTILSDYSA